MRARKASIWFRQCGVFAIAISRDSVEGWRWVLKIGKRESASVASFIRKRDAERAALAVWKVLFGDEWGA